MTEIPESIIIELLTNPVMAAKVLMNWEMDDYQGAALKLDWWYPETIDDSGTGTGKTLRVFIYACLRAMLLPDQRVAVYFPSWNVGKNEFWPYFEKTKVKSDFFASQLKIVHGKLGETRGEAAWTMDFKNGSQIIMPVPGHADDGASSAGFSFNTLVVDDWRRCEEKGDALAKQLVERNRRETWNQEHPIWQNHLKLKGHAESPSHKSHGRVERFKKQISSEGSTHHCFYTFCYRDVSKKWAKRIRQDKLIRGQRANLTPDRFLCQLLGISARSGSSFYPEGMLERCVIIGLEPEIQRTNDRYIYILGFDVAPGASERADSSSAFVYRLFQLAAPGEGMPAKMEINGKPVKATWEHDDYGIWEIAAVYAHTLKNQGAPETSGYIHWLHQRFAFSMIVLDFGAGGGGWWVYRELRKAKQIHNGIEFDVLALADWNETEQADKQQIVHAFKRDEKKMPTPIGQLSFIHDSCRVSDNGFIYAMHLEHQKHWSGRQLIYPASLEMQPAEVQRAWHPDQLVAQKTLDLGRQQLSKVQQATDDQGRIEYAHGFPKFRAPVKKDVAYSGFYAWAGAMAYIEKQHENALSSGGDMSLFFSAT